MLFQGCSVISVFYQDKKLERGIWRRNECFNLEQRTHTIAASKGGLQYGITISKKSPHNLSQHGKRFQGSKDWAVTNSNTRSAYSGIMFSTSLMDIREGATAQLAKG